MFNYNTIPFTNISEEDFTGTWEGSDYLIKVGETRYFPSFLSEHFAVHLIKDLYLKLLAQLPGRQIRTKSSFQEEMREKILGKEMETITKEIPKTTNQTILEHEQGVLNMLAEERKEAEIKRIEALKVAKDV